jgi:cation diffusion facilitator CzcD-associated flavoprotein CzcO
MAVSVAIIGAGAAGLAAARRLLAKNCNVVLFESQRSLGGVWQTANEDSALYAALRTNLPKEVMAFDDLPFHRCVIETASHRANDDASSPQQKETSFVSAVDVQRYLEEYARVYNLAGVARMGSKVTHVVPMKRHDDQQKQMDERIRATQWRVTWQDISTGEQTADTFDSVVVCNGHYNERAIPKHLSLQAKRWNGRTMHSKDYNTPDDFAGLVVVVSEWLVVISCLLLGANTLNARCEYIYT